MKKRKSAKENPITRSRYRGTTRLKSPFISMTSGEYNFYVDLQVLCQDAIRENEPIELTVNDAKRLLSLFNKLRNFLINEF